MSQWPSTTAQFSAGLAGEAGAGWDPATPWATTLVTCEVAVLCLCRLWMQRSLSFPPCRDEGNLCVCLCVCARGYYLMSILALSTHYGAGALIYPPFHALASSEGHEGLAGDALEGGPELESSRESRADPADTSSPVQPMTRSPGCDCRTIWGWRMARS